MPQFTATNGLEAKAIILDKISKALDETGDFNQNITYPWWKFKFSVKMTSYPKAAMESEPVEVAGFEDVPVAPAPENEPVHIMAVVSDPLVVDTPDQARVDADLPIPTAVPVKGVGMVDKPIVQKPAVKKGR
jgi:hypothetical protein